jgi:hypothetical protein
VASWSGSYLTCSNGNTGLGTASVTGTVVMPGMTAVLSSSAYALGAGPAAGVGQNQYMSKFAPAQYVIGTVNVDTTDTRVQNWFFKLQGNSAVLGGAGCYDLVGYYIGEEPQWQLNGGSPPTPNACAGTLEYCGTNWLHITKATPTTSVDPGGGCSAHPNYNVVTVSGSNYIAMQGDQLLSMYSASGWLDVYCKGGSHTALAPGGQGCPSTTNFYRVIHVQDTDMLQSAANSTAGTAAGIGGGYPGVWAAAPLGGVDMPVFTSVSVGSVTGGVSCASVTGAACVMPVNWVQMSLIP